jgi:hypothetical protein
MEWNGIRNPSFSVLEYMNRGESVRQASDGTPSSPSACVLFDKIGIPLPAGRKVEDISVFALHNLDWHY